MNREEFCQSFRTKTMESLLDKSGSAAELRAAKSLPCEISFICFSTLSGTGTKASRLTPVGGRARRRYSEPKRQPCFCFHPPRISMSPTSSHTTPARFDLSTPPCATCCDPRKHNMEGYDDRVQRTTRVTRGERLWWPDMAAVATRRWRPRI